MSESINRQFKLARRPVGMVQHADFEVARAPVPEPAPGQVLVRSLMLSVDPAMRAWMNPGKSYLPPVNIGDVMRGGCAAKVVRSHDPLFRAGEYVTGMTGVQDYAVLPGRDLIKIDPAAAPLPRHLSVLGVPGITAYFGLLEVGQAKAGDTVVVSGAAGAVGMLAGQIARILGCRAVGIAGGPEKCRYLVEELGFDAAIDYKPGRDEVAMALREHCPRGVDVYFDNVGGEILEVVLAQLALHARIVICGAISQYNRTAPAPGPANYMALLTRRARMEGMVVLDYQPRYAEATAQLARWVHDGRLKPREHIVEGLENFPDALNMLFRGENRGKLCLRIADD